MQTQSDADLVAAALGGDRAALGRIYDRYSDDIYSFALSRLRNREQAADATQETFLMAATRLGTLRQPERFRAWIFAIARNKIVDQVRFAQQSQVEVDEMMLTENPDLGAGLESVESAALLWDAAGSLTERDQDLLELSVRHGLDGEDLADALGVEISHLHVLRSRMNDRLRKAVGALLIARMGSEDCQRLAELLTGWDGRYTLDVRSRVNRHVAECELCEQRQTALIRGGMAYGMLPLVPAPAALRGQVIDGMADAITGGGGPGQHPTEASGGWRSDGFPIAGDHVVRAATLVSKAALIVLGVVLLALIAAIGMLVLVSRDQGIEITSAATVADGGEAPDPATTAATVGTTSEPADEDDEVERSSTEPSTTVTTTAIESTSTSLSSTTASTTTPPPPGRLVVETPRVDFGLADSANILIVNSGGSPASYEVSVDLPFSAEAAKGTVEPGETKAVLVAVDRTGQAGGTVAAIASITTAEGMLSASLTALVDEPPSIDRLNLTRSIECGGYFAVTVSASDDDAVVAAEVVWNGPGVAGNTSLGGSNGNYSAEIGPVVANANGTITVTVTVRDTVGQVTERRSEIPISNCP